MHFTMLLSEPALRNWYFSVTEISNLPSRKSSKKSLSFSDHAYSANPKAEIPVEKKTIPHTSFTLDHDYPGSVRSGCGRLYNPVGSAVLVQNVSFDYLSDVAPQIHYSVAPVQLFIPSVEEINAIKEEYVTIVRKVAARHIPLFQLFKDSVPKQSSRPVSEKLKEKTKVIPMPVLFKNEQYLQDVVLQCPLETTFLWLLGIPCRILEHITSVLCKVSFLESF